MENIENELSTAEVELSDNTRDPLDMIQKMIADGILSSKTPKHLFEDDY